MCDAFRMDGIDNILSPQRGAGLTPAGSRRGFLLMDGSPHSVHSRRHGSFLASSRGGGAPFSAIHQVTK